MKTFTTVVLDHAEAKEMLSAINTNMSHPYWNELQVNPPVAGAFLNQLKEIVGSGKHGSLEWDSAELCLRLVK